MGLTNNVRGKALLCRDYSIQDVYKYYKKEKGGKLPYSKFMKVYELFIQNVMYHIIEKAGDFRMSGRLGDMSIRKSKIGMTLDEDDNLVYKNKYPDWNRTINLWKEKYNTTDKIILKKIKNKPILYFDNKHTDGYTFYIDWDKRTSNAKNQSRYIFLPTRAFSRAVKTIQQEKHIDYYEASY